MADMEQHQHTKTMQGKLILTQLARRLFACKLASSRHFLVKNGTEFPIPEALVIHMDQLTMS